jgi:hypothetical protein
MNNLEHELHLKRIYVSVRTRTIAGGLVETSRLVSVDNERCETEHILHLVFSLHLVCFLGYETLHEAILAALTHVNELRGDMTPSWMLKKKHLLA